MKTKTKVLLGIALAIASTLALGGARDPLPLTAVNAVHDPTLKCPSSRLPLLE